MSDEWWDCESVSCEAMGACFWVRVVHDDRAYARQAIAAAFGELGRVENALSRFVEGSDVCRINGLGRGEAAVVLPETIRCLRVAMGVQRETNGAFDVCFGSEVGGAGLEVDEANGVVVARDDGVEVDLGGIGKGFGLERMAEVLRDWEVDRAVLCAGGSTVLAMAGPREGEGWVVEAGDGERGIRRAIAHRAFSGSGRAVLGDHIIDPRSGKGAVGWWRCWAGAEDAARADALSTAFMVMGEGEIRAFCRAHEGVSAFVEREGSDAVMVIADCEAGVRR